MQKSTFLVILLVSTLFVVETDAGWLSRLGRRIKNVAKKVGSAVGKVVDWVKENGPKVTAVVQVGQTLGKRSANPNKSTCPEIEQAKIQAEQLFDKLQIDCPTFEIDLSQGVTREVVIEAFTKSDTDGNGDLSDFELELFEHVLDVYSKCEEILLEQNMVI